MSEYQDDQDRKMIKKTCELVARCGRIEGNPMASREDVEAAAKHRVEITAMLVRHFRWSRTMAVIEGIKGGAK